METSILDEAGAAYLSFIDTARALAPTLDEPLDDDDAIVPTRTPVPEVDAINLVPEQISSIIRATGYKYDHGWLHVDVIDTDARFIGDRLDDRSRGIVTDLRL